LEGRTKTRSKSFIELIPKAHELTGAISYCSCRKGQLKGNATKALVLFPPTKNYFSLDFINKNAAYSYADNKVLIY